MSELWVGLCDLFGFVWDKAWPHLRQFCIWFVYRNEGRITITQRRVWWKP